MDKDKLMNTEAILFFLLKILKALSISFQSLMPVERIIFFPVLFNFSKSGKLVNSPDGTL